MPSTYRSVPSYRWLSRKHECEWAGIRCDEDGYVRVIDLSGQYIRGKLPIEFKELRFLQSLLLSWNQLSGTVPEEYGNMQYLVSFEVGFNDLTGTLPTWSETHNLQLFNVGANSLTGTIPTSIKTMINLGGFYIWDNALRGTIPEEIGYMSTLSKFSRFKPFCLQYYTVSYIGCSIASTPHRIYSIDSEYAHWHLANYYWSSQSTRVGLIEPKTIRTTAIRTREVGRSEESSVAIDALGWNNSGRVIQSYSIEKTAYVRLQFKWNIEHQRWEVDKFARIGYE